MELASMDRGTESIKLQTPFVEDGGNNRKEPAVVNKGLNCPISPLLTSHPMSSGRCYRGLHHTVVKRDGCCNSTRNPLRWVIDSKQQLA
ncbi:hypothetical protein CDAR_512631 [Caerostris darwini]|uniref:Uncharacterized protein n=1 Tax=Caerostris darwini TaxID=1538125 RepID=A0AAV4MYK5_9ARAC|nr:hypothetical protein CDAR_512631 [Caerostris darwini]